MKRFLIAISLFFALSSAFAQETMQDVLNQIAHNNLSLKALGYENEAQVLDIQAENTFSGPSLEYSPFFQKGYSGLAQSELIVSEEFQFPTKYSAREKQALLQRQAGQTQYNKLRREILFEAQQLCLDIIRVNQTLKLLNQRQAGSHALHLMYEKRMQAGDANILEMNKVELDCMEVQTLVTEAQNERALLLQQLQQLNGGIAIDITTEELPEFAPVLDYESFSQLALSEDADILAAEAAVKSASHDVNITKKEWLPNISVGYRRNTDKKEQVNGMLVGVSFPLVSNKKKVNAAKQRLLGAELQVQQTRQDAEAVLRSRYNQLVRLQQVLDHSDVKKMNETLELLSKALQHGEISALQYYTEINSIYEKLQRHIDVHCQSVKLMAELHKNEL